MNQVAQLEVSRNQNCRETMTNLTEERSIGVCGERIKYYRSILGWTQDELARRSGYSDRLIRKAEGGHSLSFETLKNLAQALCCNETQVSTDDLISSPQKSVQNFVDFGFSHCDDIRFIHEIASADCELEFNGDARIPLTGTWLGVEGLFRWLKLFRSFVSDKECPEDAVVVVNDQNGFIHMRLHFGKKGLVSEPFDMVLRVNFLTNKICNVCVICDAHTLGRFFLRRSTKPSLVVNPNSKPIP